MVCVVIIDYKKYNYIKTKRTNEWFFGSYFFTNIPAVNFVGYKRFCVSVDFLILV
jgi:hypothetical protein